MKRKHKNFSKPKRPFDKQRIIEEAEIVKNYGLKNKREIWKADSKLASIRQKAKKLISATAEEQEAFFDQLKKIGLNVNSIADVLSLEKNDFLDRRLQTIVSKKFQKTPKTSRQLITHKHVAIDGKIANTPSYIVPIEFEEKIQLKLKTKEIKEKAAEQKEVEAAPVAGGEE